MHLNSEFIDLIKYSKDDPSEYGINLDLIQKNFSNEKKTDHGRIALISNYVKISNELFPNYDKIKTNL